MKPSDNAIVLALITLIPQQYGYDDGFIPADAVRRRLNDWGFGCNTQQVGAWLARLARETGPMIIRKRNPWDYWWHYKPTRSGYNHLRNGGYRLPAEAS